MKNIDEFIEMFNDGDTEEVIEMFGGLDIFMAMLTRRNKLHLLDTRSSALDDYVNEILLGLYKLGHYERFFEETSKHLGDISVEGGKIFCTAEPEDYASLFCDGRDYSQKSIEAIISGNMDNDWYWGEIDVYESIIGSLDNENTKHLQNRMVEDLKDIQVSPETEELELIASEQGHEDYVIVNNENIERIFKDEDTMNYILENDLDYIGDLKNAWFDAERVAFEDECYEDVWKELTDDFFTGEPEWVSTRTSQRWSEREKKYVKYSVEEIKIEVSDYDKVITEFLENYKGYSTTLEYHGSFIGILKDGYGCLSPRLPEYADWSLTRKYFNQEFKSYF
jgi:hypothetical protein